MNAPTTEKVTFEKYQSVSISRSTFLDDEQWDDWLACYAPSASFGCLHGMTTIPDEDPQSEISFTTQTAKV
jgi:benzoate/toluate 1,2-dioxygenase beta subunit